MEDLPRRIRVYPSSPLSGTLLPPSSKYHTLRYVLAAFLALGISRIYYPAQSADTDVLLRACTQLGATIQIAYSSNDRPVLSIQGAGGMLQALPHTILDVGNAGAVLRLLLGISALSPETITFTTPYPESLGRRPNGDLLHALNALGAEVESKTVEGTLPIQIRRGQLRGGKVHVSGKKSSQFISSLLFLGPLLEEGLDIEIVDGLTSASFIDLTIQILQEAGISILTRERYRHYIVPGMQRYSPGEYIIPGDYPSAAALLAAVAIAKGKITLFNLSSSDAEGESILRIFIEMGMQITRTGSAITARSQGHLRGITFDGNRAIDCVPAIVATACFAQSPSRIYNIANLRLKESDRIYDLAAELSKPGCNVIPSAEAIEIYPAEAGSIAGGVDVDAHTDHRLIEALAAVGLGSEQPITVTNAYHVAKSYPSFFADLTGLGARIEEVSD